MTYPKSLISRIQEFQKICWDINKQSDEYRKNIANWERIYFTRKISIWITYFLRNTPITPTQITILWFFLGIFGAFLLLFNSYELSLLAVSLLYVSWILDNVDGELARYKKQFSLEGNLIDMLGHQIIPPSIFCCLTLSMILQGEHFIFILSGLLATTLVTPLTKMQQSVLLLLSIKALSSGHKSESGQKSQNSNASLQPLENHFLKAMSNLIALIFTEAAILYLLIIAVIFNLSEFYVVFYGISMPLVFIPKYLARSKMLNKIANDPLLLKNLVRPEWMDG